MHCVGVVSDTRECQEWIDTINFVAASYSAPCQLNVTEQRRFQRPLLPAHCTTLNLVMTTAVCSCGQCYCRLTIVQSGIVIDLLLTKIFNYVIVSAYSENNFVRNWVCRIGSVPWWVTTEKSIDYVTLPHVSKL